MLLLDLNLKYCSNGGFVEIPNKIHFLGQGGHDKTENYDCHPDIRLSWIYWSGVAIISLPFVVA